MRHHIFLDSFYGPVFYRPVPRKLTFAVFEVKPEMAVHIETITYHATSSQPFDGLWEYVADAPEETLDRLAALSR